MPSQALEAKVRIRYLPGTGVKAQRAVEIPKLPAERREWLEEELQYMPQLLDYNRHLLDELADPELLGIVRSGGQWRPVEASGSHDGQWSPGLAVAYEVGTEALVAKERWRWFYMYGVNFRQKGTEARLQDFSP